MPFRGGEIKTTMQYLCTKCNKELLGQNLLKIHHKHYHKDVSLLSSDFYEIKRHDDTGALRALNKKNILVTDQGELYESSILAKTITGYQPVNGGVLLSTFPK